jgi:hypothetical protein
VPVSPSLAPAALLLPWSSATDVRATEFVEELAPYLCTDPLSSMKERVLSRGGHGPRIVGRPEVCDGRGVWGSV